SFNSSATTGVSFDGSDVTSDYRGVDLGATNGNDTIIGTDLSSSVGDHIRGYGGDDYLSGLDGDDLFTFDASELDSNDTILGGAGNDDHILIVGGAAAINTSTLNISGVERFHFQHDFAHSLILHDGLYDTTGFEGNTIT